MGHRKWQVDGSVAVRARLTVGVVAAAIAMILVAALSLLTERDSLWQQQKDETRDVVDAGWGVLAHFHALEQAGTLTKTEAQRAALAVLRDMRYSSYGYYWINDMQGRFLLQPAMPALEGRQMLQMRDANGRHVLADMVDLVRKSGAGFISYVWPKPGHTTPDPKLSYVRGFTPWGWIIGSGEFVDHINQTFWEAAAWQGGIVGFAVLLLTALMVWVARWVEAALRRYAAALALSNAELHRNAAVFDAAQEGIVITDAAFRVVAVNPAVGRITRYDAAELLGKTPDMLQSSNRDTASAHHMAEALRDDGRWQGEAWGRRKDGSDYPQWLSVTAVKDESGQVSHYVRVFADISALKETEAKLDRLAHHDALTGLPNRLLLDARVEHALTRARRNSGMLAVLFIDLDRFKYVNDTLGHPAGDLLLQQVAQRIVGCVRAQDTVSRLGGDEFTVLLEELEDAADAGLVARKILGSVSERMDVYGHDIFVSASVGISIYPQDGDDAVTLFRNADSALYRAKDQGRNNYQYYTEDLTAQATHRLEMENDLRQAVEAGQMVLHYQPQVDLRSGRIDGMEALVRWQHPRRGLLPPQEFIPLAEEIGTIIPLGHWVLRTACRQAKAWLDAGVEMVPVAVNLSALQFRERGLVNAIAEVLHETGLPPDYLEIEITEGLAMFDAEETVAVLQSLKAIGVRFAVDDFGTGYSSLSYLKRLPIDRIKIDRSFVANITTDPDDAAISKAIISLSHSMKRKVVAEGVETEAQREFLAAHECDMMQGFHFSRPIPAADMEGLLRGAGSVDWTRDGAQNNGRTLLLVDDEVNVLHALTRLLRRDGYRILSSATVKGAFELLALHPVGVVVADQRMPEMEGVEFLRRVRATYPDIVRIMLAGHPDLDTLTRAINEGGTYRFLTKPWDDRQLRDCIADAFEQVRKPECTDAT